MSEPRRFRANPDVSCGVEEDGALLYDPDTDVGTVVNPSGRALWAFLETPRTLDEMAAHLVATYSDVTPEVALRDATRFVESLMPDFVRDERDEATPGAP